jgi:hypothetical protein
MKDETMIYEGICKYCGQITPVLANTQKEADMLVTEECDCTGADAKKRKEAVEKNAELIVENKDEDIINILRTAGMMILEGRINQLTLSVGEVKYKVGENSKGQIKFTRTKTKQEELQG